MGTCKLCEKSGFFLRLSKNGLCETCDIVFRMEVVQAQRHINESVEIIKTSKNTDTIIGRFDFIAEILNSLLKYEKKGITTITPTPSEGLKAVAPEERDGVIVESLENELGILKASMLELKTKSGKLNRVNKFIKRCDKYKLQMHNPKLLAGIEEKAIELQLDLER